ncbi:MAG: hydroxymethylbilane synthase [Candidatus Odinarchaeota archaeon]
MNLTIGTRGSNLALAQTNIVVDLLKQNDPDIDIRLKIIKTRGDTIPNLSLRSINDPGFFQKELDTAVSEGIVDIAVHSMKDMPVKQQPETIIACVPERGIPNDALISKNGVKLMELPQNATIGTGSFRRKRQINFFRPDLNILDIRGNVDTRLKKLDENDYDAIILAEAGLIRLKLEQKISERLSIDDFTPATGQGALAVVAKADNQEIIDILKNINDENSYKSTLAERALIKEIGGGCGIPIGAYAEAINNKLVLIASAISMESKRIFVREEGGLNNPDKLGIQVARKLLFKGKDIIFNKYFKRSI